MQLLRSMDEPILYYPAPAVEDYKATKRRTIVRRRRRRGSQALGVTATFLVAFVVSVVFAATGPSTLTIGCVVGSGVGLVGSFIYCLTLPQQTVRWVTYKLRQYSGPVPATALVLADRLKRAHPNLRFTVDELKIETVRDPFLAVHLGIAKVYIDFWDEKAFAAQPQL